MAKPTIPDHEFIYDRAKEVEEFDQTKAGVKGLIDSGILNIPRFFVHPPENLSLNYGSSNFVKIPVIDFGDDGSRASSKIVEEVREACQTWGFFQLVNHGISLEVMENMLEGIGRFHEQPTQEKTRFYSRDFKQKFRYYCNGDLLVSKAANWRDSISCEYQDGELDPEEVPPVCRSYLSELKRKQ